MGASLYLRDHHFPEAFPESPHDILCQTQRSHGERIHTLNTRPRVTNKDFQLARKIEEVIQWQPAKEAESALEGTPDDPRFKYIKYD